jgi:hypothetical protein
MHVSFFYTRAAACLDAVFFVFTPIICYMISYIEVYQWTRRSELLLFEVSGSVRCSSTVSESL